MKLHCLFTAKIVGFASMLLSPPLAQADIITVEAWGMGWYTDYGLHENGNYICGTFRESGITQEFRNFFLFTKPVLPIGHRILSAKLELFNPSQGYQSPDPSEQFAVFHTDTSATALYSGTVDHAMAFDDLGEGSQFGTHNFSNSTVNRLISVDLNALAITHLNSVPSGEDLGFGGSLLTLSGGGYQNIFAFSYFPDVQQLTLNTVPIPEPAVSLSVLLGCWLSRFSGCRDGIKRRRKAKS